MKEENAREKDKISDSNWFWGIFESELMFFIQFSICCCWFWNFLAKPVLLFLFILFFCWSTWEFFFKTGNFALIKWLQCYVIYCTFLGFYLTTFRAVSCAAAATLTLLRLRSFHSAPASAASHLPLPVCPFCTLWHASPQFCWRKTCESDGFKRGGRVTGGG